MAGNQRSGYCPDCGCGPGCDIHPLDDFSTDTIANYTQVSGSWAVTSGQLDPPASGVLKVNAADPGTGDGVLLRAWFNAGSATGRFFFIIDYVDASNYHYLEIRVNGSSGNQMQLGKRTGGVNTALTSLISIGLNWANTYIVQVCKRDGKLAATHDVFSAKKSALAATTFHGGAYAALETISVGSSARFDNLEYQVVSSGCEECRVTGCSTRCTFLPFSVSLTLTGISECSGQFNSTFVVDWDDSFSGCGGTENNAVASSPCLGGAAGIDELDWEIENIAGNAVLHCGLTGLTGGAAYEWRSASLGAVPLDCSALGGPISMSQIGGTPGATCTGVVNP